jgi:hypothetical protein
MNRRTFFRNVAGSGVAIALGSSLWGKPVWAEELETCANGLKTSISADPRHELVVSREDVTAGIEKTYHIQGTSDHDHLVTLTADDFAKLASGSEIEEKTTITLLHRHTVHVKCA